MGSNTGRALSGVPLLNPNEEAAMRKVVATLIAGLFASSALAQDAQADAKAAKEATQADAKHEKQVETRGNAPNTSAKTDKKAGATKADAKAEKAEAKAEKAADQAASKADNMTVSATK